MTLKDIRELYEPTASSTKVMPIKRPSPQAFFEKTLRNPLIDSPCPLGEVLA